jgi:predicted dehydrogenase
MVEPINAAIIGLGRWGKLLVSSVDGSGAIQFTRAVTRTPSKVEAFCVDRGLVLSDNLDDALSDSSIDALVIATPHTQHYVQLLSAAGAGKHVYCEKPWTLDAAEAHTTLAAFSKAGLKVAIGHNRRFAPNSIAMKDVLRNGQLGAPVHIDGHFNANLVPASGAWRDSREESPAGGMTSLGIHALDMFINLFGRVTDVHAQSKRVASPIDVDDSTLIRMNFENGCTGHLTTLSATNMLWRISVFCLGGWVEIRDQDKMEVASIEDGTKAQIYPGYEYPAMATIRAALESFGTDVAGGPAFPIKPEEIEHATEVLSGIVRSANSGETIQIG